MLALAYAPVETAPMASTRSCFDTTTPCGGGMELGFAAFFALTAFNAEYRRLGLLFALCMYAPIVLYRAITVLRYGPLSSTTLTVAVLEIGLLFWGVVLWTRSP